MSLRLLLVLNALAVAMANRGFLLTGPKNLVKNSVETYCISLEKPGLATICTLSLIDSNDSDRIYASTTHILKGRPCLQSLIC